MLEAEKNSIKKVEELGFTPKINKVKYRSSSVIIPTKEGYSLNFDVGIYATPENPALQRMTTPNGRSITANVKGFLIVSKKS